MESSQIEQDRAFMAAALDQARVAASLDEVPIGAVVVKDGRVIAAACNRREIDADPAGHAEFLALKAASERLGVWRLTGCTVYVTLEPCLMCAGLMYQARVDRCVYAAPDPKGGALGSLYRINEDERLNHAFEVTAGVLEEESAALLRSFFREKRRRNKLRKAALRSGVEGSACSEGECGAAAAPAALCGSTAEGAGSDAAQAESRAPNTASGSDETIRCARHDAALKEDGRQ